MKRIIVALIFCLIYGNLLAQITIMENTPQKIQRIAVYDSLSNFTKKLYQSQEKDSYTFHHLIGQTVMFCGDPYSYYDSPNLNVGAYYKITDLLPDDVSSGKYHRLQLLSLKDSTVSYTGGIGVDKQYNYQMVVLGHYEKLKQIYVGKQFVYVGYVASPLGYDKEDRLINLMHDTINHNITKNTIWECVDVQVKPRKKGDRMQGDYRSPIVLVMENTEYGKYYCYIETDFGVAFETFSHELPIIGPCFREKKIVDAYEQAVAQAKKQHWDNMIRKYGGVYGALIAQGKVRTGMTKEMCEDSWGTPIDINKTTGIWGVHEQWVYKGYSYLYFENGILTSIQN